MELAKLHIVHSDHGNVAGGSHISFPQGRIRPTGILTFVEQHGTAYGGLCAGVLISIIPVMIVYFIFQKYYVAGMAGAIKQ